ncbi:MAG TPA: site-specific integrase [Candidatus Methylomirabilis sp.]|nr:site-specific integrase [Candidatus Methylomirabilis sp.]
MSPGRVRRRTWTKRGPTGHQIKVTSWGFTVQVNGKQQKRFNADWTKEEAQAELAKFLLDKQQRRAKPITLADAAARYAQAKARKRTLGEDKKTLKRLMAHFGRETRLDKLTADVVSQYRDQRFAAGSKNRKGEDGKPRPLTAAAVNRELALIRHLLNLAHEEWGALAAVPKVRLEKEPQGRLRWLTPEEATRLLARCRESKNPTLADVVEFCLFTGLRQGEALGLTWDRVDRSRGVVLLEVTKSGRRREVPLNSAADAVLVRRTPRDGGLVFGTASWYAFRSYWEKAVTAAKIDDFRFHDLRHTFASWAVQRGATLQEVKDLLGHSSLAMVMRYAHLSPEHLRRAVGRLDGLLSVPASAHDTNLERDRGEVQPTISP